MTEINRLTAADYQEYVLEDIKDLQVGDQIDVNWLQMCKWVTGYDLLLNEEVEGFDFKLRIKLIAVTDNWYEVVEIVDLDVDEDSIDEDEDYELNKEKQRGII